MSDAEWEIIEPLLPPAKSERGRGRKRTVDMRAVYNAIRRTEPGFAVLPRRWVVERTLAWLGKHQPLSKDYERLPQMSECFVYQAMTALMLQRLTS